MENRKLVVGAVTTIAGAIGLSKMFMNKPKNER
jgi:hypothetical protein